MELFVIILASEEAPDQATRSAQHHRPERLEHWVVRHHGAGWIQRQESIPQGNNLVEVLRQVGRAGRHRRAARSQVHPRQHSAAQRSAAHTAPRPPDLQGPVGVAHEAGVHQSHGFVDVLHGSGQRSPGFQGGTKCCRLRRTGLVPASALPTDLPIPSPKRSPCARWLWEAPTPRGAPGCGPAPHRAAQASWAAGLALQ